MRRTGIHLWMVAAILGPVACSDSIPTAMVTQRAGGRAMQDGSRHLIVFNKESLPGELNARVAALGGTISMTHPGIGVAAAVGLSEEAARQLAADSNVLAVEPSDEVSLLSGRIEPHPSDNAEIPPLATTAAGPPTGAQFYARQWNMAAIHAPEAWAAGHLGSKDVVVGLVDTGLDYSHPDFVGLVDIDRSVSFVPEDEPIIAARFPGRLPISDIAYHGTAVASMIATNGVILAGVNQRVTFVVVKVFNETLTGTLDRTIQGILYAADQGVDVINLSAAFSFNKHERPGTIAAFQRAANYAFRKGAVLVTAAGNDARDLQQDGDRVRLPCEAANVVCVSATGPTAAGGLTGPWENVDEFAPYSAFGESAITVTAPGGAGIVGSGRRLFVLCSRTTTGTTAPACRAGQPVAQPAATSFSTPHVAGLAALLVAAHGTGNPGFIRARLAQSADDLGAQGADQFYGRGRINAARALRTP